MNIVIISYRVSGNDGVSLECKHWKEILERMGHKVTFLAGELDQAGVVMPELHFHWPNITKIHDKVVYGKGRYRQIEARIFDLAGTIEGKLRHFFNGKRNVDLLIVPNIFSLPMHFGLSIALARVIDELNIPTIARHHDFWWERKRYLKSQLFPFFERWFPPRLPQIKHVVINSIAQEELKKRTGLEAEVIGDSFNYSNKHLRIKDKYSTHFRKDFGIADDDVVFLQATRIVPRKRVELSVKFMKKLNYSKAVFVIAGKAGDEGKKYLKDVLKSARHTGIRFKFIGDFVNSKRRIVYFSDEEKEEKRRIYTLWDCYNNSDFVLYPTKIEGFGNQFVEAVFFKKPIIMTPYPVYEKDIAPHGFQVISISPKITKKAIKKTLELIKNSDLRKKVVEENLKLGEEYFSYNFVERKLDTMFDEMNLKTS